MKLGCYYFNWCRAGKWASIKRYAGADLRPVLGWYDDKKPEVHDWQIKQATRHGIKFWVFDWYFDVAKDTPYGYKNAMLDKGFLNSKLNGEMEFSVMWCNEERDFTAYEPRHLTTLIELWGELYFSRPNYLRTPDGRNIILMTRPDRLIDTFGYEGTKDAINAMREAALPWGGLFFATIKYPTPEELSLLVRAGFDACTLYSYMNEGMKPGENSGPYEEILKTVEPIWRSGAESGLLPIIPLVSPNWDSRPWAGLGGRGSWRTDPTPEKFEDMCRALKRYVDPYLGLVLIGTWNEFGEGSHIEPTVPLGCSYLDAAQRGFFPEEYKPHELLCPSPEEKKKLIYKKIPADGQP